MNTKGRIPERARTRAVRPGAAEGPSLQSARQAPPRHWFPAGRTQRSCVATGLATIATAVLVVACQPGEESSSSPLSTPDLSETSAPESWETIAASEVVIASNFDPPPDANYVEIVARLRPRPAAEPLPPLTRKTLRIGGADGDQETPVRLAYESSNAYFFVNSDLAIASSRIAELARFFEASVWSQVTATFGAIPPGDKVGVVISPLAFLGAYFSPADNYPRSVYAESNEGRFLYIHSDLLDLPTQIWGGIAAHELTHMIQFFHDPGEEIWVNEGTSELANELVSGDTEPIAFYLEDPTTLPLNTWAYYTHDATPYYGAAHSFLRYVLQRTGGSAGALVASSGDGFAGVGEYLYLYGGGLTLEQAYADWLVANLLDPVEGIYAQPGIEASVPASNLNGRTDDQLQQFAARYHSVALEGDAATFTFSGQSETTVMPGSGSSLFWWSNRGDVIDSTLTAELHVSTDDPVLEFETLFDISEYGDYGYISLSADAGATWTLLESNLAHAPKYEFQLGPGYDGVSSPGWRYQEIDLSSWAGQDVLIRFEYVTDIKANDAGWGLRRIELNGEPLSLQANGWVMAGPIAQNFLVQVVLFKTDGSFEVLPFDLDASNRGSLPVAAGYDRAVVVVSPITPDTTQDAAYTLSIE
jgi:immune inhibitor A